MYIWQAIYHTDVPIYGREAEGKRGLERGRGIA
jgi:hypothetical protein